MAHKILLTKENNDFLEQLKQQNKSFKKSTFIKAIITAFAITNKKKNIFLPKLYNPYLSILTRYAIELSINNINVNNINEDFDELLFLKKKKWEVEVSINFSKNDLEYRNSLFEYEQFKVFFYKNGKICLSCFINTVLYCFYNIIVFVKTYKNDGWNYLKRFDEFKKITNDDIKAGVDDFYTRKFSKLKGTKDFKIWVLLINFFMVDVISNFNVKNVIYAKEFILKQHKKNKKIKFDLNVIKTTVI